MRGTEYEYDFDYVHEHEHEHESVAEGVGFEPTVAVKTTAVFKTARFNHSRTPP